MNKPYTFAFIMAILNLLLMFLTMTGQSTPIYSIGFFIVSQIWTGIALIQLQLSEQ